MSQVAEGTAASRTTLPGRLPPAFWLLWTGFLVNRLGLLTPGFLALYLSVEGLAGGGEIGLVIGGYGVGLVAGGLVGGLVADRVGPRRALCGSQLLSSATGAAFMVSQQTTVISGLAVLSGVLTAFPRSAVYSLAGELIPPAVWVRAYGRLYWAIAIGTSVSTLVAGALLNIWPPALFLPGVIGTAGYAMIALALPEAAPAPRPDGNGVRALALDLYHPFRDPSARLFLILTFVISCVYMQRQSAMPLDMHRHGLGTTQLGAILSLSAALVVVIQPMATRLTDYLPYGSAFALSAALIGVGFGLNVFAHSASGYVLAVVVWTCGEILLVPLATTFMTDRAPPGRNGTFQGAYAFVWTLGLAIGAPAGQLLLEIAGSPALWISTLVISLGVAYAYLRASWLQYL